MIKIATILSIVIMISSCDPRGYFKDKYFNDNYKPTEREIIGKKYPETYQVKDFRHISYSNAYCSSASLEMYNETINIENKSIHYYNWLMGFSYGAFFRGSIYSFIPYTDPEPGMDFASPFLGLNRNYYICNDSIDYVKHLKELISNNHSVRVAVNAAIIRINDKKQFWPHSIILTGYDESNFVFYETGHIDKDTINSEGELIDNNILVEAVYDMDKRFGCPWKYNFTTFEKTDKINDEKEVWERNGKLLIGRKIPMTPIWEGSAAINALSVRIKENGISDSEKKALKNWIETAEYTRKDNSTFILQNFNPKSLIESSEYLEKSSINYKKINKILNQAKIHDNGINDIVNLLKASSGFEKKAGELMIEYSGK
ncbi:MAG: hypothetical protein ISR90_01910 [Candidatus Marinimicrobia bacterium]|nr:hypothetical protein [Candidatus Neomarinimicrobiota bacterium]MBL7022799.1 hypothetical protein [Candidatus Neomarinimicrobiota bacterium]MBL7109366.1 hypothetical protein [Candidatus Neomarinimicrobiota bacterium]